jgi:catechol 2,3-dioxygenase-like lactoylglutathione lyase family enzyme
MSNRFLFVDHVVFIVKDLKKSEKFYSAFLSKPVHKDEYSIAYQVGDTKLFLGLPYRRLKRKNLEKEELVLNHLVIGIRNVTVLKLMKQK